jgi:hypothetical protein
LEVAESRSRATRARLDPFVLLDILFFDGVRRALGAFAAIQETPFEHCFAGLAVILIATASGVRIGLFVGALIESVRIIGSLSALQSAASGCGLQLDRLLCRRPSTNKIRTVCGGLDRH